MPWVAFLRLCGGLYTAETRVLLPSLECVMLFVGGLGVLLINTSALHCTR